MEVRDVFKLVETELYEVEQELERQVSSDVHIVSRIARYIHNSGGKRVRPALLLLCSRLCGYRGEAAIQLAAAVELIHSATLVHDDIIDDAKLRRGRPSVNAAWGNQLTVLIGDWLYVTSMRLALCSNSLEILKLLTEATQKMIEGELLQLSKSGRLEVSEEDRLEICRRKTAYLFSACARIGAMLGRVGAEREQELADFGLNLGLAFQLIDDLLDFTSSETTLGKPVVSDLKEGKLTLPLIYLLELGVEEHAAIIQTVMRENGFSTVRREEIIELVREHRTLERTRDKAMQYVVAAKRCLDRFPDSPFKQALLAIPDFIVSRDR